MGTKKEDNFPTKTSKRGEHGSRDQLWIVMVWVDVEVLLPTIQQVSTTHWRTHTHLTSHHCMREASVLIYLVVYYKLHTERDTLKDGIIIALLYCHFTGLTLTTHTSGRVRKPHHCMQCTKTPVSQMTIS